MQKPVSTWRNTWFNNPLIWLAESILAYISGATFFPNIGFVQKQQIIKIFSIEQIQWKLMTKFFFNFKTAYFWLIFPILGAKMFFQKIRLSYTTLQVSSTLPKFREI